MQFVYYPELNKELSLPIYVTGIGIDYEQKSTAHPSLKNPHLLFTVTGRGKIQVNGEEYDMSAGCAMFINREIEYDLIPVTSNWQIDWVSFEYGMGAMLAEMFTSNDIYYWELGAQNKYISVMRSIYDSLTLDSSYGGYTASSDLYRMIITLNRECFVMPQAEHINPAVYAAITYINEHYAEEITLEHLCEASGGFSEQYICRLFKQATGMRPVEYILKKRISVARSLLENTDIPIPEIASKTGFNNTSYFYRNFKKFIGTSPLSCRQKAVAANAAE